MSKNFIIFSHQRSGSTTLSRILHLNSDINTFSFEPFNTDWAQNKNLIQMFNGTTNSAEAIFEKKSQLDEYINFLFSSYDGFKHIWYQLKPEYNKHLLLRDKKIKIIFLWRKNFIQAAVSDTIAKETKLWHVLEDDSQETKDVEYSKIKLDKKLILKKCETFKDEVKFYRNVLKKNNSDFIEVCYEDIFNYNLKESQKIKKINEILRFLEKKEISLKHNDFFKIFTLKFLREHSLDPKLHRLKNLLNPKKTKLLSEKIYKIIPNINEIDKLSSKEYGYLLERK
ncbi:MAG: hypothetical protein CMI53_03865 [Parcubacteria group bacterium]|nr:hypothetical protein [Parcubacteria group bacterium]|tara:strand:+ start:4951 stop:5799 length:849 start_codon:yes stop_codon:yes gene_type:complete